MTEQKVTLKDIYAVVNRIEDKYDSRFDRIQRDIDELQKFQNKALGVLAAATSFMSLAATYVWNKIISG